MSDKVGGLGGIKSLFNLGKLFKGNGGAGWIFALILVVSLFKKKKKKPEVAAPVIQGNYESATYSFGGGIATTVANDNAPVPLVFGRHVVGGNIVNSFISSNSVTNDTATTIIASASIVYVSSNIASGSSVYKIASCPSASGIYTIISVPADMMSDKAYENYNKNAVVDVHYSTDNINYTLLQKVPLLTVLSQYGYKGSSHTRGTGGIYLPLMNSTVQDIYLKLQVLNYTVFASYTYSGQWSSLNNTTRVYEIPYYFTDYPKVAAVSYNKPITVQAAGAVNQRLYMDVVLSAGEIRNLRSLYINDRLAAEYRSDNKIEGVDRNTQFRFRPGFDSFPDLNLEGTLDFQSTVYNQSDVGIEKIVGGIISTDMGVSSGTWDGTIYIDDTTAFHIGDVVSFTEARTDVSGYTVNSVDNDSIVVTGSGAMKKAGDPIYIHATASATYIDFQYVTQSEHLDGVVIGLNASDGLYNTNQETGAIYNRDCDINIKICPATLSTGSSATFPLYSIDAGELLANTDIRLRGARRTKLWFDQSLKEVLTVNSSTGEKKYLIEIRKTNDNTLNEYAKNKLQVAYVEELVNRELVYNGCSYCGVEISANSKVSNGTPNLRFEVDGALVPKTIHNSIRINTTSSTTTDIRTEFNPLYGTSTNYVDSSSTAFALSGLYVYHANKMYSMSDDQSISFINTGAYYDASSFQRNYNNFYYRKEGNPRVTFGIYKAYFKCDESWYRRFVVIKQEKLPGAPVIPTSPDQYRNVIKIITLANDYLTDNATNEIKSFLNNQWLAANNTALPSVPTDMVLYEWSDNPAWIVLFLLCDENNGAKIPLEYIDLDSFSQAAAYYDSYIDNPITSVVGDVIKRCSINIILDSYSDLRSHLEKILTISHSALYNSNDKIKFLVEAQLQDDEFIISLDEEQDLLELSVSSVPAKDMPNQLAVVFLDENDRYNKKSIVVEDSSLSKSTGFASAQKQDIDMFGLTNESHVLMEAMRIIKAGRYVKFGIQLKTALSGLPLEIYDGFKLTSTTYGWTNKKFRCVGIKINQNKECEIDAIEYYDEIYELGAEDLINYHEVSHTDLPKLTEAPEAVQDIVNYEEAVRNNSGSIEVNLVGHFNPDQTITFNASGTAVESDTRFNYNKTDHVLITLYHKTQTVGDSYRVIRDRIRFNGNEFRFNNLQIGSYYYVVVEPVSPLNAIGIPKASTPVLLEGKKIPPLAVASATWTRDENDYSRYILAWEPNTTDFDMANYRVRFATSTGSWDTYEYQLNVPFPLTSFDFAFFADQGINYYGGDFGKTTNTNFQIMMKCVDTSGNESEDELILTASATLDPDNVASLAITSYNSDDDYPINITWVRPTGDNVIRYEVKFGTATATWENAQYSFSTKNTWLYLDHGDVAGLLASQTGVKVMVKGYNFFNRVSSGASATKVLTLAPTTVASGSLELAADGVLYFVTPDAPTNKDFLLYQGKLSLSADPEDAEIPTFGSLASYANTRSRILRIPTSLDNTTFYLHYRAMDKYFYVGAWNSDFTMLVDVIPAAVSSTQMKYKVTNSGISLLLPDKSQELSWDYYDVHLSASPGFTPDVTTSSPTRAAVGKTNKFEINQFNDGTPLNGATTYYIKVRSLSKYAPTTETYHSAFNSADLEVTTSDATAPVLTVNALTPSGSIIIGDTLTVDYTVTDNGSLDRTRGRVYESSHLGSATWTDPMDLDSHTFALFPSSTDGSYVLQMQAFDAQGNYVSYSYTFSRDTAVASAPVSVSGTQLGITGVLITVEVPVATINIKEYVVEYAIDTGSGYGAWVEIYRDYAASFVESFPVAGYVKFRAKTVKVHSATLDSAWTESTPIYLDVLGPTLVMDVVTPNIFLDSLLTSNDVTFHFIATDSGVLRAIDPVMFSLDSAALATATTLSVNASGTAASGTVVLTDVADGSHQVFIRAYDTVGNTTDTVVYRFEIDTTAPDDLDPCTVAVNGRTITITTPDFTQTANFAYMEYTIYNADNNAVVATLTKK